ncbi:hypothetical protein BXZ70DRAFT_942710 [Cristinia sonorae]|uniref:Helicase C-terminal domain-containing protein n=1 Tax=Cristinia sonorae TaxID=1940300 RepID=A0A8K0UP03_9AGAR|nr:hypothetical protein BXZ70DRAFT_942710 [Cristinia sonorae]
MTILPSHSVEQFQRFLAAGTLSLPLKPGSLRSHKNDTAALPQYAELRGCIETEDFVELLDSLYYLINKEFVATQTYLRSTATSTTLVWRVYLIPYDLPGVHGRLRRRDKKVLDDARSALRTVLPHVARNSHEWDNPEYSSSSDFESFYAQETDDRTMAELYSSLASPNPQNIPIDLDSLMSDGRLRGMRSKLYSYQRRSVEAMICQEMCTAAVPNPLYVPLHGIDGSCFYFQPATMEILAERPMVPPSRGGILCEELGTGKTIMTLALVLSTLDQLPEAKASLKGDQSVLTPLSVRAFRRSEDVNARTEGVGRAHRSQPIPSLREHLVHYCRVNPDGLNLRQAMDSESLLNKTLVDALEHNVPFCLHYDEDPVPYPTGRSVRRKAIPPRLTYLSSATLIIVPPNLLYQWKGEIDKHCEDWLRVLVVRDNKALTSSKILATKYDVILMSHTNFINEARKPRTGLFNREACRCRSIDPQIRVPRCTCGESSEASPLLRIRWKRLVVDEGHNASDIRGNLTTLAKALSVERRWIVTGTPTTNLMGLKFGDGGEAAAGDLEHDDILGQGDPADSSDLIPEDAILQYPDFEEDEGDVVSPTATSRVWTKHDRGDLNKLSNMIGHFLATEPFNSTGDIFKTHVIDALMPKPNMPYPRPGSCQMLRQLMEMVMIRHRCEDVEKDVLLPKMQHETVLLDLERYGIITYNVMQAGIALNAVDSERTDMDYIFHPSNRARLQQTIENMTQAMFWHTDDTDLFNLPSIVAEQQEYAKKAETSQAVSRADRELLHFALRVANDAMDDKMWKVLNQYPNVFHQVTGLPQEVYTAWTNLSDAGYPLTYSSDPPIYLCSPERLFKLREMIFKQPLSPLSRMIAWGPAVAKEDQLRDMANMSRMRVSKVWRKQLTKTNKATLMKEMAGIDKEKLKSIHDELAEAQANVRALTKGEGEGGGHPAMLPPQDSDRSSMLDDSPLARVRIRNSMSSKLNYILKEVLEHVHTDKFLIFSRSPLTLAYISESLELLQVKYLSSTSQFHRRQREHFVTTFETSEAFRVFLMELKHGARGLNIVSANRVIFCEPVWQADVETQAIKRVHRIGQTKPVFVKTLTIRNTFEEFMLSRRQKDGSPSHPKQKSTIADDVTMRDFIANPTFLSMPTFDAKGPNPTVEFPFLQRYDKVVFSPTSKPGTVIESPTPSNVRTAKKPRFFAS